MNNPASTASAITDEQIRTAFLANGFTIKEGHDDLKPYVYAAARAVLALQQAAACNHCLDVASKARAELAASRAPTAQPVGQDGWPKLEKPARLDGGTFGVGVSSRHVVEAAQRQHERHAEDAVLNREQRHEQEMRRRMGWDMLNGYAAPTKLPKWDDKPLRWCDGCGEGVTSFCRGKSEACPMFEAAAVEPSQPEAGAGIFSDFNACMFRDECRARASTPPAPAAPSPWQPIETAPKDRSEILLGRAANEELGQNAISTPGYWQEGYEDGVDYMGVDDGFVDSNHQVFGGGRSFGAESYRHAPNQPTHWMPLPTPPAALAASTKGADL